MDIFMWFCLNQHLCSYFEVTLQEISGGAKNSFAIIFVLLFVAHIFCELVIRLQFAFSLLEMINPRSMLLLNKSR